MFMDSVNLDGLRIVNWSAFQHNPIKSLKQWQQWRELLKSMELGFSSLPLNIPAPVDLSGPAIYAYVTRFAKRGLLHAQFQEYFLSPFVSYISGPTAHVSNTAEA